jgi:glycerol-3-phosphate acyltransferase PlsY
MRRVATSAGAIFGLMPLAAVTIFVVWVVVFEITRYVSLASLVAASALPVTVVFLIHWEIIEGAGLLYFSTVLAILVVWRHRSNFSRLLKGTEQRFTRK